MNTEELRIVRGNAFNIEIKVQARRLDGTKVDNFHLADANAQLKVWHAGELTPKEFVVEDNNAIISFDGTQGLGWYGLEMSGTFEGAPWRFAVVQVFQIVETNEKANVPSWTILTDQTYFVEGVITMYASGASYQADWDETDTTSPSYIKNKPNLGVYATKSQLHSTEQQLQHNIDQEESARKHADQTLQGNIDAEETRAKAAEKQNADDIDAIEEKIPAAASAQNQLADKNFVNSSIATSTATFRGTYNEVTDLELTTEATHAQIEAALATKIATADNNDYCFVQIPTATATPTEIAAIERYKFNGTAWAYEYTLNNSGFTAAQWAAINSGITSADVVKLLALPTNSELTTLLNGKQDTISDLQTIREGAAAGATAYQKPAGGIPSTDMTQAVQTSLQKADNAAPQSEVEGIEAKIPAAASAQNQLADKNFVNSSIATATATYRGSYNVVSDLSLSADATHAQIEAAIATKLAALGIVADNNDYCFVQIPTSTATPTEIASIERYKFNGTAWSYEYTLNNSGFTSDQWAAINSGITNADVVKLLALPTNSELTTLLNGKQDTISDLQTIRDGAEAGATAYQKPAGGIPSTDMTQAVQTSLQKADNAAPQASTYTKTEIDTNFVGAPGQSVLAQAFAVLFAAIDGLKAQLGNLGDTKAVSIDFEEQPKLCGQPLVIEGSGAPTAPVVPTMVGQRYHDTANRKVYEAFAVTNSVSDWVLLN